MSRLSIIILIVWTTVLAIGSSRSTINPRFIVTEDINGNLKVDDLLRTPSEVRASIDDLTFYLYTRANADNPELLTPRNGISELTSSEYYKSSNLNIFVVHGLNNDHTSACNNVIYPAILDVEDANVFVADWSGPANKFYTTAVKAVPVIGEAMGQYIKSMMETFNLNGKDFRLIGHSLGAHVCGAAGSQVNGDIEYIVGLDPAGPLFGHADPEKRLDKNDANFVEIIHTSDGKLGYSDSLGHVDFYPNGGSNQPGCILDIFGICAHSRAYYYYAESIKSKNFVAKVCDSYEDFEQLNCEANKEAIMGQLNIDERIHGDYYLDTSSAEPYALG